MTNTSPPPNAAADLNLPDGDDRLQLTLGLSPYNNRPPPPAPADQPSNPRRRRQPQQPSTRSVRKKPSDVDNADTIEPPYPWATDRSCRLHTLEYLKGTGHVSVTGRVQCKKCEKSYEMAFDLEKEFYEIGGYILKKNEELRHRAPAIWMSPALPECRYCKEKNAARPEIAGVEKTNWLFLFLGQMVGCCKHEDLKYYLSKNGLHRTAAKDRLVYLVYLSICKQLDPNAPFDL